MATHSNILEWRIPWAEEPGSLHSPRGLKESDRTEQLSFPLHINIFKSKLTVIIKFFLNTAFPLGSEDKGAQYISLYYFIVGNFGVASRVPSSISNFKMDRGTSLETLAGKGLILR